MPTLTITSPTTRVSDLCEARSQRCSDVLGHIDSLVEDGERHCRLSDGHDVVNSGLVPGIARTLTYRVRPRDLVNTLFPESPEFVRKPAVLATGILVALCEWPAMDALRQVIGDDEDSLGTGISLSHQAPVCAGTKLTVTARCVSVAGRVSRWDVSAYDGARAVACGWVEFAVVRTAAFLKRHMLMPASGPIPIA